ncbi:SMI1/KNR4 family protein [Micromonospora sp. NPDC003776]
MTDAGRGAVAERAIHRIDEWLRQNAPLTRSALRPPASEADIATVEEALGRRIPVSLRALWAYADGAYSPLQVDGGSLIPPSFAPYSIAQALDSRETWMRVDRRISPIPLANFDAYVATQNRQPAGTRCDTWLPAWLPIASDHGGGDLFVDLRDGRSHGCVLHYRADAGVLSGPEWSDVAAMLFDIAERMTEDECHLDEQGRLSWRR